MNFIYYILFVIALIFIIYAILKINMTMISLSDVDAETETEIEEEDDKQYEIPKCPDCGSYELKFVDNLKGVEWIKKTGADSDFYMCKRCGRYFSDENWQEAKKINR